MLVDCISGLPIAELTTTANIADSTVALNILADTHFSPVTECTFLADKRYGTKVIYNQIAHLYNGECFIPLNKRGTKTIKTLPKGNPICEAGLAMHPSRLIAFEPDLAILHISNFNLILSAPYQLVKSFPKKDSVKIC